MAAEPLLLQLHNANAYATRVKVMVCWGSLPPGSVLYMALDNAGGDSVDTRAAGGRGKDGPRRSVTPLRGPQAAKLFPPTMEAGCGRRVRLDRCSFFQLAPDGERRTHLPEVLIGTDRPAMVALKVVLPPRKPRRGDRPQFDVVQLQGGRVVGGCTVVVAAHS
jgi:hypothetical protein